MCGVLRRLRPGRTTPHGAQHVANQLHLAGATVSAAGVRGVWLRHDLETRLKRLLRLERHAQATTFVVSFTSAQ